MINTSIFEYDKELEDQKLRKAEYEAGKTDAAIETARRILDMKKFTLEEISIISGLSQKEIESNKKTL